MATTREEAKVEGRRGRPVLSGKTPLIALPLAVRTRPELRASIDGILNRHPAVGLAVGIVRDGSLELFDGHGFADIASNTPVTEDTVFRIGSITKPFTAIAVMQLQEQGLIDLDAPANDYLRAYELIPAQAGLPARDRAPSADPHRRDRGGPARVGICSIPRPGRSKAVLRSSA